MNLEESVEWRRGGNSSHSGYSAGSTSSAGHHLNQDTTDNNYNNDNPHHHNILDDYDLGQCIGRGGFATVYKATRRRFSPAACLPRTHAIKIIHKQDLIQQKKLSLSRIHNEIAIHRQLQHPNIVQFLDSCEDDEYIYMILEYTGTDTLFRYLKRKVKLSEEEAVFIICQLLQAMDYLHRNGVIHRDLKLSNILLDTETKHTEEEDADGDSSSTREYPYQVKLCDFGLAVGMSHPDEEHYTLCGTPNYIAPEIVSQQAHSYAADIWSIGCLFYTILIGTPPFEKESIQETLQEILKGEYVTLEHEISDAAVSFLQMLLQLDPGTRPNVKMILAHPLLMKYQQKMKMMKKKEKVWKQQEQIMEDHRDVDTTGLQTMATTTTSLTASSITTTSMSSSKAAFKRTQHISIKEDEEASPSRHQKLSGPKYSPHEADIATPKRYQKLNTIQFPTQMSHTSSSSSTSNHHSPSSSSSMHKLANLLSFENPPVQHFASNDHLTRNTTTANRIMRSSFEGTSATSNGDTKHTLTNSTEDIHQQLNQLNNHQSSRLQVKDLSTNEVISSSLLLPPNPQQQKPSNYKALMDQSSSWIHAISDIRGSFSQKVSTSQSNPNHNNTANIAQPQPSSRSETPNSMSSSTMKANSNQHEVISHCWMDIMDQLRLTTSFLLYTKAHEVIMSTPTGQCLACLPIKEIHSDVDPSRHAKVYMKFLFHPQSPHIIQQGYICDVVGLSPLQSSPSSSSSSMDTSNVANLRRILIDFLNTTGHTGNDDNPHTTEEILMQLIGKEHIFRTNLNFFASNDLQNDTQPSGVVNHILHPLFDTQSFTNNIRFTDFQHQPSSKSNIKVLPRLLQRIASLLRGIKCRIPKLVVYYPPTSTPSPSRFANTSNAANAKLQRSGLGMKCMLMCNHPLPDFHVQWSDGTVLNYSLQQNSLYIFKPEQILQASQPSGSSSPHKDPPLTWKGNFQLHNGSKLVHDGVKALPQRLQTYLKESQAALTQCLQEEQRQFANQGSQGNHIRLPVVVVS